MEGVVGGGTGRERSGEKTEESDGKEGKNGKNGEMERKGNVEKEREDREPLPPGNIFFLTLFFSPAVRLRQGRHHQGRTCCLP